jgi:hypothetical protein
MASLADAYVRIRPDTSGLDADGISKPASEMGKKAGEAAGKSFGISFSGLLKTAAIAAAGIATGQIAGFFKSTITAASDVAESTSKIKVVFGQSSKAVLDFGKQSATSMGISQAVYREAVGTLGNLFVALKLPGPQAVKMSTDMVKLSGDLASFNNTKPEEALDALRSALIGETEPMQRYGVNINAATLQTQALKMGLIDSVKDALTPAQKATATYALIMDQTRTAQGDFARTQDGLANSTRIAAAQWDDLKAKLGEQFLPIATKVFQWIKDTALPALSQFSNGLKGIGSNAGGIAGDLNTIGLGIRAFFDALRDGDVTSDGFVGQMERAANVLRDVGGWINRNKDWIGTFVGVMVAGKLAVDGYTASVRVITSVTEAWAKVQAILDGTLLANPIGLIVVAVAAFIAAWIAAYNRVEWFHNAVNFWFGHIGQLALWLWHEAIVPAFNGVMAAAQEVGQFMQQVGGWFKTAFDAIGNAGLWLWHNAIEPMWKGIKSAFDGIVSAGQTMWNAIKVVWDAWTNIINATVVPVVNLLWHSVIEPAFGAIKTIIQNAWIVVENVFKLWVAFMDITWGNAFRQAKTVITGVWDAIKAATAVWWDAVKAIFTAVVDFLRSTLGPVFTWFRDNVIIPVWNGIKSAIDAVWNNGIKPIFTALGGFLSDTVAPAFKRGVELIGQYWDGLRAVAKAPVNFIIGTVINRGIIDSLNWVTDKLGHAANLGHLQELAGGGMVRGPGTGTSDSILGLSEGGMPTARVSNGEFVVNAKQTRKNLPLLRAINSNAPGYADGGLVGDVLGLLANPLGGIVDYVKSKTPIGEIVGRFGNSAFVRGLTGIPEKVIDAIGAWVKDKLSFFTGGAPNLGGPSGSSIGAILALAQRFYPGASISSGYRPGDPGWHGTGLAADIIGGGPAGMAQIAAGFYGISGRLLELIHSGGGGFFVKNGVRVGADFYRSEIAGHYNHVHVAANANALGFADGGVINEPIWGVGRSGRRYTFGERGPETIIPGVVGAGGGFQFTVNVHGDVSDAHVQQIKTHVNEAFNKFYVQLKTGRRR